MAAISVIVPTRNEAAWLPHTLRSIPRGPGVEIIVSDGGSTDETLALAAPLADRLVESAPGRGSQLNAGAAAASGDILLFLHADTRLNHGALDAVRDALRDPHLVGGAFRAEIDSRRVSMRLITFGINLRSRWLRLPYGDQALFVRRRVFDAMHGFRSIEIMEDVDFVRRLRRHGRLTLLRSSVRTSARRWAANGVARTTLANWAALALFFCRASPAWIRRFYDAALASRERSTETPVVGIPGGAKP